MSTFAALRRAIDRRLALGDEHTMPCGCDPSPHFSGCPIEGESGRAVVAAAVAYAGVAVCDVGKRTMAMGPYGLAHDQYDGSWYVWRRYADPDGHLCGPVTEAEAMDWICAGPPVEAETDWRVAVDARATADALEERGRHDLAAEVRAALGVEVRP